ncbi:MAG: PD-(D/E)XK nuclease superfamily protein [Caldilinea sp.]
MQQGSLANSSGNTLEQTIVATLVSKGFEVVQHRAWKRDPQRYGNELLLCNVPYQSIYGHDAKTEFVIRSKKYTLEVRVECKWQQVSGSVDEKFPYLYINCLEGMPENHVIIVLDGGGAKPGAVGWLRRACANKLYTLPENQHKRIDVMSLSGFLIWANRIFR